MYSSVTALKPCAALQVRLRAQVDGLAGPDAANFLLGAAHRLMAQARAAREGAVTTRPITARPSLRAGSSSRQ